MFLGILHAPGAAGSRLPEAPAPDVHKNTEGKCP